MKPQDFADGIMFDLIDIDRTDAFATGVAKNIIMSERLIDTNKNEFVDSGNPGAAEFLAASDGKSVPPPAIDIRKGVRTRIMPYLLECRRSDDPEPCGQSIVIKHFNGFERIICQILSYQVHLPMMSFVAVMI